MIKRLVTLCATVLSLMALPACGGSGAQDAPAFNQADVDFAAAMSPHHSQAITMAELAATHAQSPNVKALAARIREAQSREVDRIAAWLQDWGSRGATMPPHGIGHEAHGPGMLTDAEMDQLGRASGREFDRLFLTLMIRHHEAAIQMATEEIARGKSAEAQRAAENIKSTQSAEITEMKQLLARG
jgi:uncharacterized protein (DUF305 family)